MIIIGVLWSFCLCLEGGRHVLGGGECCLSALPSLTPSLPPPIPSCFPKSAIQASRRGGQQRPSLLFDSKEAADVDTYTIHQLACDGLALLIEREPRLTTFRSTLLSDDSQSLVRELQTREANQQLDATMIKCLRLLSPFADQEAAIQVIEYLIRKYQVQSHCVDPLLKCFLPYHDLPIFTRVVMLLRLDGHPQGGGGGGGKPSALWIPLLRPLLHPPHRPPAPLPLLPRAALVRHCLRETGFLSLVLLTTQDAWQHSTLPHHPRLTSLYSALLLETLEKMGPVTEQGMRVLLPPLLRAVKAKNAPFEFKLASYMALSKLASTTSFSPTAAGALMQALGDGLKEGGGGEGRRESRPWWP